MCGCKITAVLKSAAGVSVKAEVNEDGERRVCEYLISEESWKSLGFSEGSELTPGETDALEAEAEFCRAAARTLKILSYSAQSKTALVRKLCKYGFDKDIAVRAADDAELRGDLNESRQAEHLADYYLRHKYWGKKRIAAELMSRGYCKDAIVFALSSVEEDRYTENLTRLVESKPAPEDCYERDKYISSLSRMGYSLPEILKAIDKDK